MLKDWETYLEEEEVILVGEEKGASLVEEREVGVREEMVGLVEGFWMEEGESHILQLRNN